LVYHVLSEIKFLQKFLFFIFLKLLYLDAFCFLSFCLYKFWKGLEGLLFELYFVFAAVGSLEFNEEVGVPGHVERDLSICLIDFALYEFTFDDRIIFGDG